MSFKIFSKFASSESKKKISSEPSENKTQVSEHPASRDLTSDDSWEKCRQNIVRDQQVSSEHQNIVRSIVRPEIFAIKSFRRSSDGSDDIFTLFSGQANSENFLSERWGNSSPPPVGAISFGQSGVGYPVTQVEDDCLVLTTPNGLKRVSWSAVIRWEVPAAKLSPNYHLGQRIEVFFSGKNIWRRGYRFLSYSQDWLDRAWLRCPEGHEATCKANLLRGER
jgi:hypothetical protein